MPDRLVLSALVHQLFNDGHDIVLEDFEVKWLY